MSDCDPEAAPGGHGEPPMDLCRLAAAIALSARPAPRDRAALFLEHGLAGGVEAFRRRHGNPAFEALDAASAWLDQAAGAGRRVLLLGGPGYPALLAEIAVPPVALEVDGSADLDRPAVAVVGSRRASPYGLEVARTLAAGLAAAGLTVVSGLARGIDQAAHRAALDAGGATGAVLGGGLDRIYPPEHAGLARDCAASGALLSEFPPGTRPLPRHFPRRNRIIAGLTLGTVVVEAAVRSGSLSTARHAADAGRDVCAVPGPVGSETSAGCHAIIRTGAALVTSADEVVEELGIAVRPADAPAPNSGSRPVRDAPDAEKGAARPVSKEPAAGELSEAALAVLRTIRSSPAGLDLDSAVALSGVRIPDALAALSELERSGRIRRYAGDFLKAAAS